MKAVLALSKLVIREIFRKKDFYVAFILVVVILLYASSLQFYNVKNIVRYLMEIGLALIFLFSVILTISIAARQYPTEIQNRTCQVLLAKPISRLEFVLGKFLGSFAAGASCFLIFYAFFLAVTWQKGGGFPLVMVFEAAYLFLLNLMVVAAMASGLSYILTVGANITTSLIIYILINTYGGGLKTTAESLPLGSQFAAKMIYYFLPHFEFFDLRQRFIHEWGSIGAELVLFLTGYALVYTLIFLTAGWAKLRSDIL